MTTIAGGNARGCAGAPRAPAGLAARGAAADARPEPHRARTIASVLPPRHFEDAVAAASRGSASGDLDKVVLAREVSVEARRPRSRRGLRRTSRALPVVLLFCVGLPEAAFLGASPELLVRRRGASVATVALAGSTRRSADPAVDDHLDEELMQSEKNRIEHRIVSRRIARKLASRSVWVEAGDEPEVIKVANIQHLATPVHAQLADPSSAVDLAALLHPTPAVAASPMQRLRR